MENIKIKSGKAIRMVGLTLSLIFFLALFLSWGHQQGRSAHIVKSYLCYCTECDGTPSLLTIPRTFTFLNL